MSKKVVPPTAEELAEMERIDRVLADNGLDVEPIERLRDVTKELKEFDRLTSYRDELIIRSRQRGSSLREIAAAAGMSHVAIAKKVTVHDATSSER
jgi:hypothetical protein